MNTENMLDKIIKTIQQMSGKYGVYKIFDDWVKMMAIAFSNQVNYSQKMEDDYINTIKQYDKDEQDKIIELMAWLVEEADERMMDMLGYIYMHLELGSKKTGQFFTPYHICQMMARMQHFDGNEITVNEPSCGAGGNIIALAESMKKQGLNYQELMKVTCQDIDIKAVYMTYVQLYFYGIPAIVYQADTLSDANGEHSSTGKLYTYAYLLNLGKAKGGRNDKTRST